MPNQETPNLTPQYPSPVLAGAAGALRKFTEDYFPRYRKYGVLRIQVKELFERNKTISQICQETNLPFQTVYKWKKKYGFK